jgi:hypothetical protein
MMIAKRILMAGQPCILACDAQCQKAWGINNRPRIELLSDDEDDYYFLPDQELGYAPNDPGTREGDEPKPIVPDDRLNKWCARECERSVIVDDKDAPIDFELPDYSVRQYNIAPHIREDATNNEHN